MPRYVILNHDHPFPHWDLLLEMSDACRTWRLHAPLDSSLDSIRAEALDDHRLFYLDYEGPVSNDRGTVTRWDAGQFEWIRAEDDQCEVHLIGRRWSGRVRLFQERVGSWGLVRLEQDAESRQ